MANQCYQCGKDVGFFTAIVWDDPDDSSKEIFFCSKVCHEEYKGEPDESNNPNIDGQTASDVLERNSKLANISLSTLSTLPGNADFSVIGVVTAECVFGMNIFRDVFAALRDVVGGRSEASEKVLKDLKQTCLSELKKEAYKVDADAVLGVDLDYSEFSGGGKSMLFLVASGTAVKIVESEEE